MIEPSGVGKLSDVIKAVKNVDVDCEISLNSYTTVVDVNKCKMYMRNFGEFFENQLEYARTIILSRTDTPKATEEKVERTVEMIMTTIMSIIMMENVAADMTTIMSIITMMENAAVAVDMTMITIITIIMQMRCSQAGDGKRRRSIRRKRSKTF